jgi:hypothetical protein
VSARDCRGLLRVKIRRAACRRPAASGRKRTLQYRGKREAAIPSWNGDDPETTMLFEPTGSAQERINR